MSVSANLSGIHRLSNDKESTVNTPACVAHLDDIQAHLIRGAKPAAARYYFLGIRDVAAFLAFMQQPLLHYIDAENPPRVPTPSDLTTPGWQRL